MWPRSLVARCLASAQRAGDRSQGRGHGRPAVAVSSDLRNCPLATAETNPLVVLGCGSSLESTGGDPRVAERLGAAGVAKRGRSLWAPWVEPHGWLLRSGGGGQTGLWLVSAGGPRPAGMGPGAGAKPRIRDGHVAADRGGWANELDLDQGRAASIRQGPNPSSPAAKCDGASIRRLLCPARAASHRAVILTPPVMGLRRSGRGRGVRGSAFRVPAVASHTGL